VPIVTQIPLPGIGVRYEIVTEDGTRLAVVRLRGSPVPLLLVRVQRTHGGRRGVDAGVTRCGHIMCQGPGNRAEQMR
jgi:hypothetical protein